MELESNTNRDNLVDKMLHSLENWNVIKDLITFRGILGTKYIEEMNGQDTERRQISD